MKKIVVDTSSCIGCGACFGRDPEHFDMNAEGYSVVKSNENIDLEVIQDIIASCPVGVISLEEDSKDEEDDVKEAI